MKNFVGRKHELALLEDALRRGIARLVVIKGRRRIGKSRLAEEFGKDKLFYAFTGLAPNKEVTAKQQKKAFARQLAKNFSLPNMSFSDWSDGFDYLSLQLDTKPTVILFDEVSWMGSKDPTFLPKLKIWWDLTLQKHPNLILILCSSVSTWLDKNILKNTAFFGRISTCIELDELSLPECHEFLKKEGIKGSHFDFFRILSVTGGIPWYLEQIDPNETIDANIKRLCFEKNGMLVHEFDNIFHDLFSSRGTIYKAIIQTLDDGMRDLPEIRKSLQYSSSGSLNTHLRALEICKFVSKHYSWSFKSGTIQKKSLYRLSDNYLRFYLRYIEPNLPKIEKTAFQEVTLSALPGWETIMGYQLENLLLNNRSLIYKALGIHPQDIAADNPYFQRPTIRHKGCQIDYLIQTHSNTLYICEIKMRKRGLDTDVIDEMKQKIARLAVPRGFGICPVLFHLGPLSDALATSRYFFRTIDIADFLED